MCVYIYIYTHIYYNKEGLVSLLRARAGGAKRPARPTANN